MTAQEFAALFHATKTATGWMAKCTAHKDDKDSLSISENQAGWTLLNCFAGCETKAVLATKGLTLADLFPEKPKRNGTSGRIVAAYDYHDETRKSLFQCVRFEPKDFSQRRPDPDRPGEWIWNIKGVRRVLFRLPDLLEDLKLGLPVFVAEGEKDCLALLPHGLASTCNPLGAESKPNGTKWIASYDETLRGADVIVIADKDVSGRRHAQIVAGHLNPVAKSVKVLELPDVNGKPVKDAFDFFAAGGTAKQLGEQVAATPAWIPAAAPVVSEARADAASTTLAFLSDGRRKIQLPGDDRLLSDFGAELADGLQVANMFTRAGRVFGINAAGDGLAQVSAEALRTMVETHICCYKIRQAGANTLIEAKRTMTEGDAMGVLASPQFLNRLRPIERVNPIQMPIRRADGCIELLPPGYDAQAKVFTCQNSVAFVAMSMEMARTIISDLLSEFRFGDIDRSRAVAVAAMLSVFAAGLLPPKSLRPCFIYLANAEGAGKTLLVKCAVVPVFGFCPASSKAKDDAEMRKLLLSAVLEAKAILVMDNVRGRLASESLEGFLSASDWYGRVLGETASFTGANNTTVFITGNGCTVSPDMRRRSLFAELHLDVERAEDRVFKNRLEVPELIERRSEILSALWTLIKAWHDASDPKPTRGHSAFSSWADTIGGIVEHAGFGCPMATPEITGLVDTDAADMRALVEAMLPSGDILNAIPFDELVTLARSNGLFERILPPVGDMDRGDRTSLCRLFQAYDRRLVGSCRFSLVGTGHRRRYQAERVNP